MIAENGLEEALVGDVGRVVVGHRKFLENHAALGLELLGVDQRRREHVGQHVDGHRQVTVLHLGVVAGVLLGRHRVVLAADGVERDRDVESGTSGRSLEQQVLEKVRRAVGGRELVARTDRNPEARRGASRPRNTLAQDPHAARKHGPANKTVSGCGEGQLREVERECDYAIHRIEPTSSFDPANEAPSSRTPQTGGTNEDKQTGLSVLILATVSIGHPSPARPLTRWRMCFNPPQGVAL